MLRWLGKPAATEAKKAEAGARKDPPRSRKRKARAVAAAAKENNDDDDEDWLSASGTEESGSEAEAVPHARAGKLKKKKQKRAKINEKKTAKEAKSILSFFGQSRITSGIKTKNYNTIKNKNKDDASKASPREAVKSKRKRKMSQYSTPVAATSTDATAAVGNTAETKAGKAGGKAGKLGTSASLREALTGLQTDAMDAFRYKRVDSDQGAKPPLISSLRTPRTPPLPNATGTEPSRSLVEKQPSLSVPPSSSSSSSSASSNSSVGPSSPSTPPAPSLGQGVKEIHVAATVQSPRRRRSDREEQNQGESQPLSPKPSSQGREAQKIENASAMSLVKSESSEQKEAEVDANASTAESGSGSVSDSESEEEEWMKQIKQTQLKANGKKRKASKRLEPFELSARDSSSVSTQLSEYERLRMENIRKNQEMMASLNLMNGSSSMMGPKPRPKGTTKAKARKRSARMPPVQQPVRRSSRQRKEPVSFNAESFAAEQAAAAAAYVRPVREAPKIGQALLGDAASYRGVRSSEEELQDQRFSLCEGHGHKCYGVAVQSDGLLVGGGHGGMVSLYQLPTEEETREKGVVVGPLFSHKLHSGWIGNVSFVTPSSSSSALSAANEALVLTSSNDKSIVLSKFFRDKCALTPIARASGLHDGGIFCHVEAGGNILTCSKDKSVVLSKLGEAAITCDRSWNSTFTSVVKNVDWQTAGHVDNRNSVASNVFAACENSGVVALFDTRANGDKHVSHIEGVHARAINDVTWHHTKSHLLMSTGFDRMIATYDIRSLKKPLATAQLRGHDSRSGRGPITRGIFSAQGNHILTPGEGPSAYIYSLETHKLSSTFYLGFQPTFMLAHRPADGAAASAASSSQLICGTTQQIWVVPGSVVKYDTEEDNRPEKE